MIYLLRQFIALAETHSYIRASEKLRISQPALTKNIKKLEQLYQCQLIERSHHGCSLTDYGRILYTHAIHIDQELHVLETEITRARKRTQSRLTVAFGILWQLIYAADIFLALKESPIDDLTIVSKNGSCEEMIAELLNGKCDLYLGKLPQENDSRLVSIPMLETENSIFAHSSHPLAAREQKKPRWTLEHLRTCTWTVLGSTDDLAWCDIPDNLRNSMEQQPINYVSSMFIIVGILQKGEDLIILPKHVGERFSMFGIEEIEVDDLTFPSFVSGLTYRRDMEQNSCLQLLVSLIQDLV